MNTISKAQTILSSAPREAMRDALGLAGMGLMIFAGFIIAAGRIDAECVRVGECRKIYQVYVDGVSSLDI